MDFQVVILKSVAKMDFQVVILAGGFSSNLQPLVSKEVPKALLPVANRPVLSYALDLLESSNLKVVEEEDAALKVGGWISSACVDLLHVEDVAVGLGKELSIWTAMHLDRPPAFMRNYLHRFDVLVLNIGHHWNRGEIEGNHWVMHVNGTKVEGEFLKDISHAKVFTIHSVVKWLDAQLPLHPRLKAFFRTISPRHFRNGDWNTGGNCNNTVPLSRGSEITGDDGSVDATVESAVNGTRIKILDITALSELRDEVHISGSKLKPRKPKQVTSNVTSTASTVNDCLHWCLPGIPDTWNELFIAQI